MDRSRIAELLRPFVGDFENEQLLENISTYIDILLRWNARINLTAIRDPDEIVTRHFGESLFAARCLFPGKDLPKGFGALAPTAKDRRPKTSDPLRVADVGSGAGFPGIPLKLWAPKISLTLIESNHKKATFLREIQRALTLTDIDIQNARAETLPPASFDVVTLRAVERFETALPIAAGLVRPGGRLALLIGSAQLDPAQALLPDWHWAPRIPVPLTNSRVVAVASSCGAHEPRK